MSQKDYPEDSSDKVTLVEEKNSKGEVTRQYNKGRFLGKGGFAKCYEFTCIATKKLYAAKVICKASLNKNRAKQKLMSEIKIHKSIHHTNIVDFQHFFEDSENVYILLEVCDNNTMSELLRRRKRLTELEAQCYMTQIISAIKYLHAHRVIHRDLKLGNLFLSNRMEIKLGDFGLATKLEYDGEKKRTICGTPNYIAPEILEGKTGHSYEVDIWSIGVILYTFLIGKPPFETSDVKTTYRRIRMNSYSFPDHVPISSQAKSLITSILALDPSKRPSLDDICSHEFFNMGGTIPKLLPVSTLTCPPSSSYVRHFVAPVRDRNVNDYKSASPPRMENTTPVQVESKALLNERKDFINTDRNTERVIKGCGSVSNLAPSGVVQVDSMSPGLGKLDNLCLGKPSYSDKPGAYTTRNHGLLNTGEELSRFAREDALKSRKTSDQNEENLIGLKLKSPSIKFLGNGKNVNHLGQQNNQTAGTNIWVRRWVDYSSKYGLGYLLSNGCIGVFFNDSTKIILSSKEGKFMYAEKKGGEKQDVIIEYAMSDYPKDLQKKVTLLQHFKSYLEGEETKNKGDLPPLPEEATAGSDELVPIYVKKWMKTKHAIMFRMSSKMVQVIFQDQTEILLSSELKVVTYVNKKHERLNYPLSTALQSSNQEMTKRLKYTKDTLTHMLGDVNIIPTTQRGDENKKYQTTHSSRNTRSASNINRYDPLGQSGQCSTKRNDGSAYTAATGEEKGYFRLSAQTGRPSLQTVGSNPLLERGL